MNQKVTVTFHEMGLDCASAQIDLARKMHSPVAGSAVDALSAYEKAPAPAKKSKPAPPPPPVEEPAAEEQEETEELTTGVVSTDDVIEAMQAYAEKHDRKAAIKVLAKFKVKSVHDLSAEDIPKILKMLKG